MAVGKMTVAKALSKKTGYKFFHNHQSIEFGLQYFPYGTEPFRKIDNGIRRLVFETISEYEETGFIFTFVWAFNLDDEQKYVKNINAYFEDNNWEIYFIELQARLEIRKERNIHPDRLDEKPSKRDIERSQQELDESMDKYKLNSDGDFPLEYPHLVINNEELDPEEVADQIIDFCEIEV